MNALALILGAKHGYLPRTNIQGCIESFSARHRNREEVRMIHIGKEKVKWIFFKMA